MINSSSRNSGHGRGHLSRPSFYCHLCCFPRPGLYPGRRYCRQPHPARLATQKAMPAGHAGNSCHAQSQEAYQSKPAPAGALSCKKKCPCLRLRILTTTPSCAGPSCIRAQKRATCMQGSSFYVMQVNCCSCERVGSHARTRFYVCPRLSFPLMGCEVLLKLCFCFFKPFPFSF